MSISIANSVLIWYILNYRTPEWAALGRHNAIETMTDGFLLVNNINVLLDINQKVTECFPQITRQQIGKKVNDIPDFPKFLLDPAIYDFSLEIPPNGKRHFMLIRSALKTEKGKRVGQNVLMVDDTINYDITEVLRHKTQHDGLTGLYNRTAVYDIAGRDWTLSVRAKRNSCMLMFDIDFFKKVNDTYGHLIGDEVLKTLGNLLRARLRKTDIGARYGGEEFFVWVPDTNIEGAFCLAEELRKKIEDIAIPINENEFLNVTISIGISELKSSYFVTKSFEKMVAITDEALYYAKNNGRNKTVMCIPSDNGDLEFITTEEQLTYFDPMLKKRQLPDLIFGSNDEKRKSKVEEMIDKL
jgi:diguanylate cyclase (GGDEF)-like protein